MVLTHTHKRFDWSIGLRHYETLVGLKVVLKRALYLDLWFGKSSTRHGTRRSSSKKNMTPGQVLQEVKFEMQCRSSACGRLELSLFNV